MKKVLKIIKKIFVFLGYTIAVILIVLICSVLFSKKDYGTPNSPLGESLKSIAIKNVNVISMNNNEEEIQSNMTVLIDHGKITKILPDSLPFHSKYEVKEGNGKYLMPGLIDMHSHIFDRSDLPMYLGYGVTTVRNMMGFPMHLRWRKQINDGVYPGANLITASPTINGGNDTGPFHKNIESSEDAIKSVNTYKSEGYDFIKIYDGLNIEQFKSVMKTAKQNNMYVAGHPPHSITLDTLLKYDVKSYEHIEEVVQAMMKYKLDTVLGRTIAKKLKAANAKITVTLSPFYAIYKTTKEGETYLSSIPKELINPFTRFIGKKQLSEYINPSKGTYKWNVKKYECMEALVRIFMEEGVELLLGTDTGPSLTIPGITMHQEIALLQQNGIEPFDILKMGTTNASSALEMSNILGSISEGKKADILLLKENPLENLETLKSPEAVLSNGIWYSKEGINNLRDLGKDKSNTFMTIGRFLDHLISK